MIKPTNEFNANVLMSPEQQLRLMALALSGNDVVSSVFVQIAERAGLTSRGRLLREKESERLYATLQMVLASQERLARLHEKLDRLDDASRAALLDNDEKLREARARLEKIREQAREATFPDGTRRKVYRDGDKVREDSGALVDPDIARAEDVSDNPGQWRERRAAGEEIAGLEKERARIADYRGKLDRAKERTEGGEISENELNDLEAELEKSMPRAVRERYEDRTALKRLDPTFETTVNVSRSFARAEAAEHPGERKAGDELTIPGPSASRPAPM